MLALMVPALLAFFFIAAVNFVYLAWEVCHGQ